MFLRSKSRWWSSYDDEWWLSHLHIGDGCSPYTIYNAVVPVPSSSKSFSQMLGHVDTLYHVFKAHILNNHHTINTINLFTHSSFKNTQLSKTLNLGVPLVTVRVFGHPQWHKHSRSSPMSPSKSGTVPSTSTSRHLNAEAQMVSTRPSAVTHNVAIRNTYIVYLTTWSH